MQILKITMSMKQQKKQIRVANLFYSSAIANPIHNEYWNSQSNSKKLNLTQKAKLTSLF